MTITILTPNKISNLYSPLINHFNKMLNNKIKLKIIECKKKLSPQNQMAFEAELMNKEITISSYVIAMDATGQTLSSKQFATRYDNLKQDYKNIIFIIGGPYGIADSLLQTASLKLSLSAMTLPNQLAITTLIEQIYRAETIINNHPYHK